MLPLEHFYFNCGRYQVRVEIDVFNHQTLAIRTAAYIPGVRNFRVHFSDIHVLAALLRELSVPVRNVRLRMVSSEGSDTVSASVPFNLGNPHIVEGWVSH